MADDPFDEYPLPFDDPAVQKILRMLGDTYRRHPAVEDVAESVGLDLGDIELEGSARRMWRSVLKQASKEDAIDDLFTYVVHDVPALHQVIAEAREPEPVGEPPAEEESPGEVDWKGFSADSNTERQIVEGHPTLLYVSFLEEGLRRAKSVCRLLVTAGRKRYTGTGFRITDDLILTNHHVLYYGDDDAKQPASAAEAWFGWEADLAGVPTTPTVLTCDVRTIRGRPERDWAVIGVADTIPVDYPVLPISSTPIEVGVDDRVYIIQHPGGSPKMIGMHHNLVRFVDDQVVQYWTDTEGGSSGSPVFDESWSVIALHHRWGERVNDGQTEYYNQGQRIHGIVDEMAAVGVTL
jgi:hypothetical protein